MLAYKHRLRREEDIKEVLRTGTRVYTPVAAFTVRKTTPIESARVCVITGKKVHTSAVVRHRVQRLLRAVAQDVVAEKATGYDMVMVAQAPAVKIRAKADFEELYRLILKHVS